MTATADDYRWFYKRFNLLTMAFNLTLIKNTTAEQALAYFGADHELELVGAEELSQRCYHVATNDRSLVGVAPIGDWALVVEPSGLRANYSARARMIEAGATAVAHFKNVDSVSSFYWLVDGVERFRFDPIYVRDRSGPALAEIEVMLTELGYILEPEDEDDYFDQQTEAAFALAERLSGVRIDPDWLATTTFSCGTSPVK